MFDDAANDAGSFVTVVFNPSWLVAAASLVLSLVLLACYTKTLGAAGTRM